MSEERAHTHSCRGGKYYGLDKCCAGLWNPIRDQDPANSIYWPNAKEIEILSQEGPRYIEISEFGTASLRIRGVFYVPMNFRAFPHDGQFLDIHMSTMASNWQFNLTQPAQHKDPIRTADYVAGGPLLPQEEKVRMGLKTLSCSTSRQRRCMGSWPNTRDAGYRSHRPYQFRGWE